LINPLLFYTETGDHDDLIIDVAAEAFDLQYFNKYNQIAEFSYTSAKEWLKKVNLK